MAKQSDAILSSRRATRFSVAGAGVAAALALVTTVLAVPADDAGDLCAAGFGAIVGTSDRLNSAARLIQSSFDKANWTGNVRAFDLNDADGTVSATPLWQAASQLPAAASRTIFTASSTTTGVDFLWSALPDPLKLRLDTEATVNYLRGDQSGEVAQGGTFRNRASRLGPIVNSEIALAGVQNFGYDVLPGAEGSSYAAFMQSKASRTQLAIVGAEDGMLHGFDAATGVEKFAYVPQALMLEPISVADQRSTLVRLADPNFQPRYYVDGSSWVADAYWNSSWKTVVVGTAGAGAKGVFAIDITTPNAMTASKLLFDHWDVEGSNDPNLGHSIGQPVIGRLSDGEFYAIFGNGRDSFYRCPVLYLARLRDGLVRRIPTGGRNLAATCGAAPNGLGRPSLYDTERPGEAGFRITDFVYAGDLQGNVWRFDLRSLNTSAEPPAGASAQLLFSAQNNSSEPQPITGTIELGPAPSGVVGNPRPVMLWFGTGRYLATADAADTTVQSMYGMVDRFAAGGDAATAKVLRSDLQSQTANLSGDLAGTISGTPVNYPGGQHGWVVDLPRSGERMSGLPLLQPGRLLYATYVPEAFACYASGQSWIFAVDPYHGRSLAQRIFVGSPSVDFIASTVGIVKSFVTVDAGDRAFVYLGGSGSNGNSIQREEIRPTSQRGGGGRVSWREIVR